MIAQATVLDDLRAIVGDKHAYLPDDSPTFAVDGMNPKAIVEPRTYEEVGAVMRYASQAGLATIASGGRTKPDIGNLPARYDLALSLSRLDQIIEYEPADLTVTCQAGISVPELQRRLRVHGQKVPLDERPGKQPSAGGMLATNSNGPSRHAFGELRDFTIGMRVVTADGRTTRAGGKVVKNVAGYDLCKLYIGSLGTLGVIVEATFKVMPVARIERTLAFRLRTPGNACSLAADLLRRGLALSYLQLRGWNNGANDSWLLEIGLAGSEGPVARSENELAGMAADFKAEVADGDAPAIAGEADSGKSNEARGLLCRFSVLPSRLSAFIGGLQALEPPDMVAEPATGVLRASWPNSAAALTLLERSREIAKSHSAACFVERCPPELKRRIDVFGDPPPAFELMRRVKQQFDPNGILSPGRFVGRL